MRVVFDTSVILAGSIGGHVHGARAAAWFKAAREGRVHAGTTTHALAETWATATALPVEPPIAPALVERLVERLATHFEVFDLIRDDYDRAMRRCGERGLRSGAVCDALHLVASERWQADLFLTFNARDFVRLAAPDGPRIAVPPEPPGVDPLFSRDADP